MGRGKRRDRRGASRAVGGALAQGLPPEAEWAALLAPFEQALSELSRPLFHGTATGYLGSILAHGLGGAVPEGATCPGECYVAAGEAPGALDGAYAFALRGAVLYGSGGLSFRAERHGGRSLIERYVAEIMPGGGQARLARTALRAIGARYALKRGRREGAPLLLVYEGAGLDLEKTKNGAPADFQLGEPLGPERLRLALTPARDLPLPYLPAHAQAFALELLELRELQAQRPPKDG